MNIYEAAEIAEIVLRIKELEKRLTFLGDKEYQRSFKICRENEEFRLEQKVLALIITYYEKELAELNKKLSEL